jgi:putative Holliday junction resolvase
LGTACESGRFLVCQRKGRIFFNFASGILDMGRILAIDYGTKRVGIAVTDPEQIIASPMETVRSHELMHFLESYFGREQVDEVVIGHPRKMDSSDSDSMKQVRFFAQAFKKRFPGIHLEWMDERFTSSLARDAMLEGGMKKSSRRQKGNVDKVSAAIILQSYLEYKNNLKG